MKGGDYLFAVAFIAAVFCLFTAFPDVVPAEMLPGERQVKKVVSLSPSISRAVADMGGDGLIVAATRPHFIRGARVVPAGDFISPDWEVIAHVQPDLVLLSHDEGTVQSREILASLGIPLLELPSCGDFETLCKQYGRLSLALGLETTGHARLESFRQARRDLVAGRPGETCGIRQVAFLVSVEPLVAVCARSHLDRVLEDAGVMNVFSRINRSYAIISAESLLAAGPDMIIVMRQEGVSDDEFKQKVAVSLSFTGVPLRIITSDYAPYTTPGDYIATLRQVRDILSPDGGMK